MGSKQTLKGPWLLRRYLRTHGLSQADFARLISTSDATVSRWLDGKLGPGRDLAWAIKEATKEAVPISAWAQKRERRKAA